MAKLVWLLILAAAAVPAQVVEGTVINSATGNGIANVSVTLEQVTTGAYRVYAPKTDVQGHFQIDSVQDGVYRARYASPGYSWLGEYEESSRIQVAAGGKPVKLEARMALLPHISGRVLDGRGHTVAKATVQIAGTGLVFDGTTDAAGQFDVRTTPGAYTLLAGPPPGWKAPDPDPESGHPLGWARTFYPGVAMAEAASTITLRAGIDVSDLEWKLRAVPVYAIRGVVLNPEGKPQPKAVVSLGYDLPLEAPREVESDPDGAFEFTGVTDGEWRLGAEAMGSGGLRLLGRQQIGVAGRDVQALALRLDAPFTLFGKVVAETAQGMPAPKMPTVVLRFLYPERETDFTQFLSARPDADGKFTFTRVYPGLCRLDASSPLAGYYLDTMRLGQSDLPAMEMQLSSGVAPLTLVYKTNGGTVRGTVEKCASGLVFLVPQDAPLRRAGLVANARCDAYGRYEISALRSGEYYAMAFAGDNSGQLPHWDDAVLTQAARITVRAGEPASADLKAIAHSVY